MGFDSSPGVRTEYQYGNTNLDQFRYQNGNSDFSNNNPIICISNNCNNTDVKTETGVSADVTVHVNTKVEVQKTDVQRKEEVPDIPIVIGTKSGNSQDTYPEYNFGQGKNNFIPSVVSPNYQPQISLYPQNPQIGKPNYYQPTYNNRLGPSYSTIQNQAWPDVRWYVKQPGSTIYNPLEFKKTFTNTNTWSPLKFNYLNNPIVKTLPKWNSCNLCSNPQENYAPNVRPYARSAPPQVNGKLGSLD